ncbi:MAG TPA: hypothetical protein VHO46_08915 [Bacteroidales bacterium]|nr:hypothetical protein [Bacteroidales bacterium]
MYHVAGTISVATIFYLLSFFFQRLGYYTIHFHRKIWNFILAASFTFTALAGIFLALQVNNKWNLQFTERFLKLHVDAGIILAITGFFHFLWHVKYYTKHNGIVSGNDSERAIEKHVRSGINLFVVGFVSSSVQLLFLREIMNFTGGYELISGIYFGSWLILSAYGAFLAGRSELNDIRRINSIFSAGPFLSLILLLVLPRMLTISGETPSFLVSFIYTFLVLMPICIISGFTFIKLIKSSRYSAGKSFSLETTGGILSGILVPVLTAGSLNTYQVFFLILVVSIAYSLLTFNNITKPWRTFIKILAVTISSLVLIFNVDIYFRQLLLPGVNVISTHDTPYGNVTTGESSGEESIYYNHRLLSYLNDVTESEEDIHYAMLQSDKPSQIVLISGSLDSHLGEILKYPVNEITYIERDPFLARMYASIPDSVKVPIIISQDDALRTIKKIKKPVDVVIMLNSPPSTLQLNRYYTKDFFEEVRNKLSPNGVFMCSPGVSENYYNKEYVMKYSSVYNSLKSTFRNIIPIAGNKLYFVASDKELSPSVIYLTELRKISNIYVSSDYLSDDLLKQKSQEFLSIIDHEAKKNTTEFPVASLNHQSLILSMNPLEKIPSFALMALIFAIPAFTIRRKNTIMYSGALSLAGFEITGLLILQMNTGNMYQLTGILIAGLMAGLAAGSRFESGYFRLSIRKKGTILGVFYLVTGLSYGILREMNNELLTVITLFILLFIPAYITGTIFRDMTTGNTGKEITSEVYSSDLMGSALGFIISSFSIPLLGIKNSVFILALIIFAGTIFRSARQMK